MDLSPSLPAPSRDGDDPRVLTFAETALVVLAAGRSARMGSPKPLALLQGRPLLEHALAAAGARQFAEVVVVLGHHADAVRPLVGRFAARCVENPLPDAGRTGSVQAGLRALGPVVRAALVLPVDCPVVRPDTFDALVAAAGNADVVVPCHGRRHGHPPLVHASVFPRILAASPDAPLRDLLASAARRRYIEVDDPGVLVDLNTPEDLNRLADTLRPHTSPKRSL